MGIGGGQQTVLCLSAHSKLSFWSLFTPYYFLFTQLQMFSDILIVRWDGAAGSAVSSQHIFFITFLSSSFNKKAVVSSSYIHHHTHGILGLQDIVVNLASKTRASLVWEKNKGIQMHIKITLGPSCIIL